MYHHTEATKLKMSVAHKGRKFTEEHKQNISIANKGVLRSNETKCKISAANKGKIFTKEHKQKISIARKGKYCGKENFNFGNVPPACCGYGVHSHYLSPLQGEVCFRSSYELAYAKYLDSISELWMYEMETFDLGDTTYTPDFFLPRLEKFVEIKGYMLPKAQDKINQFREQYPWDLEVLRLKELKELGVFEQKINVI